MTAFGPFTLESGTLLRDGKPVVVGYRALALLEALVTIDGPVGKAALIEAAWPGAIVEEGNLSVQIAALRKALGTRPDGSEWIVTVPRVGYRLIRSDLTGGQSVPPDWPVPRLAILPFQNLSGDPDQAHFAGALVEDLITALSRFRSLVVVARSLFAAHAVGSTDAREVGAQLEARYVIEGSVRRSGQRLRVTVQLVDAQSGTDLWAQSYDGDVDRMFDMQDTITATTAAVVGPKIERSEIARANREGSSSNDAYSLYLRALEGLYSQRLVDNGIAIDLLERVISIQPQNGSALAAAAQGYEHRFSMGWPPHGENDAEQCLSYARAALEADKDNALVLAWSGLALQAVGRELDVGLEILKRAAVLNPNDVRVLFGAGVGHLWAGTIEDASAMFNRVVMLSPSDTLGAREGLAHIALVRGEFELALEEVRAAVVDDPNHDFLDWVMISAYAFLGRMDEAQRALQSYQARVPGMTISRLNRDVRRSDVLVEGLRLAGMPEN